MVNLTRVSFSFVQKHFLGQFSLIFIEHRIINLLTKRIKLNIILKSNFALTLGYLNPALNNLAHRFIVLSLVQATLLLITTFQTCASGLHQAMASIY